MGHSKILLHRLTMVIFIGFLCIGYPQCIYLFIKNFSICFLCATAFVLISLSNKWDLLLNFFSDISIRISLVSICALTVHLLVAFPAFPTFLQHFHRVISMFFAPNSSGHYVYVRVTVAEVEERALSSLCFASSRRNSRGDQGICTGKNVYVK